MQVKVYVIFIIYFFASVVVSSTVFFQSPKNCFVSSVDEKCFIGTLKEKSKARIQNFELTMNSNSIWSRKNNRWEWVSGESLLLVSDQTVIYYGSRAITLLRGEYLLYGSEGTMILDVVEGKANVSAIEITEGFEILVSEGTLSPLKAMPYEEHVIRYTKLKGMNKEQAKEYINKYSTRHENYVRWASDLNEQLIQRDIAQEKAEIEKKKKRDALMRLREFRTKKNRLEKIFDR